MKKIEDPLNEKDPVLTSKEATEFDLKLEKNLIKEEAIKRKKMMSDTEKQDGNNLSTQEEKNKPPHIKPRKKQRVKGNWKKEEDIMLMKLVRENGARNWSKIAENFPNRIGKQCRERWHNHLNPKINKKKWTEQEEAILLVTHERFGNRWALISKYLPGRTDNCIKNHWNSTMKRKLRNNFFKNYPLEELKGHLFNGQENILEVPRKGSRRKRLKESAVGLKRKWEEAMPELSKQAKELEFLPSLQVNAEKIPFQVTDSELEAFLVNSQTKLSLQSLLTLLPSPFLSDSLTLLNNLTSSIRSLLSLLLSKNPMKSALSPLTLLKQILQFLELNVSSQIQDHFPRQNFFDIKKNLIESIKKNNDLERKKFDHSMKVALDKKIMMMEQEKDRNYQLAKLIETIKTKSVASQIKETPLGSKIQKNQLSIIKPVSTKSNNNLKFFNFKELSSNLNTPGTLSKSKLFSNIEIHSNKKINSATNNENPSKNILKRLKENSNTYMNSKKYIEHLKKNNMPVITPISNFQNYWVGKYINDFQFQKNKNPKFPISSFNPTSNSFNLNKKENQVGDFLKKNEKISWPIGANYPIDHIKNQNANNQNYVSLFESSNILNENIINQNPNCFSSPPFPHNKSYSKNLNSSGNNDLKNNTNIIIPKNININNNDLLCSKKKESKNIANLKKSSNEYFNLIEFKKPSKLKKIAETEVLDSRKSNISRNLKFKFEKIFNEKRQKNEKEQLDHFSDLKKILNEEFLKQSLSGFVSNIKKIDYKKAVDLNKSQSSNQKTNEVLNANFSNSEKPQIRLSNEIFIKKSEKNLRKKEDKNLELHMKKNSENIIEPVSSKIFTLKEKSINQIATGKFISSFVLKKPNFNSKTNITLNSIQDQKENIYFENKNNFSK